MNNYTLFSMHGPLIAIATWMRVHKIWERISSDVPIPQKVVRYQPTQKLLGTFVTILTGAGGLVEANTRVRSDEALYRAFGFSTDPEQSTLSATLNSCTPESVTALRACVSRIYQRHGRAVRHKYHQEWLCLDVDLTGMPCGRQAEGASKGYFSGAPGRRGLRLGRVAASNYDEIVVQRLYSGKRQLSQAFVELLQAAAPFLGLERHAKRRNRTLIRCDGGGGTEREINWALAGCRSKRQCPIYG